MATQFDIAGPAGALEAQLTHPSGDPRQWAVLCHPHPQYGGSMHDAVLDVLAGVLADTNCAVLRFNFRGVGRSEGAFDQGVGEVQDLKAALAWVATEHNDPPITLGGYSFGAAMSWRACQGGIQPDRLLMVAPPVGAMSFEGTAPNCPTHIFAGDQDEFINAEALANLRGVTIHQIEGANHFFMGRWAQLDAAIRDAL